MTENKHRRTATDNDSTTTGPRHEGSADTDPLPFQGRSRAQIAAFNRDLADGVRPQSLGTAGAKARRQSQAPRRPSTLGVLVPGISLPKELSGYRHQDVGLLTHAVLAVVTPAARTLDPNALVEHVLDVSGALVNGTNHNRRRSLQHTATTYVCRYLRRLAPADPWELIGAEYQTGQGRTDLAWQNRQTGEVFFDEIKTHSGNIERLDSKVIDQALRQAAGGYEKFADKFLGVRVIPFGALHHITLVRAAHDRVRLLPITTAPLNPWPELDAVDLSHLTDGVRDRPRAEEIQDGKVAFRPFYKPRRSRATAATTR